jgi:hypothetical protein
VPGARASPDDNGPAVLVPGPRPGPRRRLRRSGPGKRARGAEHPRARPDGGGRSGSDPDRRDEPDRGLWSARSRSGLPGAAAEAHRGRAAALSGGQRRRQRGDLGRSAPSHRLAAQAEGRRLRAGDGCQRRPAWPGPGSDPREHRRDPHPGGGAISAAATGAARHEGPAQPRGRLRPPLRRHLSGAGPQARRRAGAVPPRRRGRHSRAEPGRRRASDRGRPAEDREPRLDRARAVVEQRRSSPNGRSR